MRVLLTGGAGYIASHIAIELIAAGHDVIVADDLSNSSPLAVERVRRIAGAPISFTELDVRDEAALTALFEKESPEAVIHLAGLKAVGESVAQPLRYYDVNINTTLTLLRVMAAHDVSTIVFSSSATVYGTPTALPLTEESQVGVGLTNPYGWTKSMIEQILRDAAAADPGLNVVLLRYFNPIGAHPSGLIGEDPKDIPNNLMPYITQVAVGRRDHLSIFGNDYDTPDGTGVRDYIHVVDLAAGHVAALDHAPSGVSTYNLGTGQGVSVLDLVRAFEAATGVSIPYEIVERRPGDIAACYASADKAERELGWHAAKTLEDACADSWRWQSMNPQGYAA
ncbi:MAG: UDP-glucose 4-epimerase GalE [Propionibacteriaceae bacterium]|jgi:UDP-glucose 4-epimerase|nr:UDP-glucose 4-epimerase GalE [Propionibacteriaceae bacterium]